MKILILLLLISCGKQYIPDMDSAYGPRQFDTTDEVFNQYIQSFSDDHYKGTGVHPTVDTVINFGETRDITIAVCYVNRNEVIVNKKRWDNMTDCDRELVIKHELGHCILGILGHRDDEHNEIPVSIMNTYHIGGTLYCDMQSGYDEELFNNNTDDIIELLGEL